MGNHGICIAVLLGGQFRTWDSVSFLFTLTTAVALLATATVVVDNLMLYVLPQKSEYTAAKYEDHDVGTGDMDDVLEIGGHALGRDDSSVYSPDLLAERDDLR